MRLLGYLDLGVGFVEGEHEAFFAPAPFSTPGSSLPSDQFSHSSPAHAVLFLRAKEHFSGFGWRSVVLLLSESPRFYQSVKKITFFPPHNPFLRVRYVIALIEGFELVSL